ncbi:MAG: aspartate 1-decarboxylase [Bacteroidia bacterium]|nr:aspartate 1-decarboxylase [Bacteroidia bacterium]MDW8332759.1 aspartate 1-decarboxylase [Bacteroidia bacterium]
MFVEILRAKIHRAKITQLELNYVGSITIDKALLRASGILPNEKVQVVNLQNGVRFETYVIEGEERSGVVGLNGPAARLAMPGDLVIILAYATMPIEQARNFQPVVVFPDENNRLLLD